MKQISTKIKSIVALLAITLVLAACNSSYQKTPSGLTYKITHGKGKETLKQGQFIQFNIEYRLGRKDSLLFSSFNRSPQFMPIDSAKLHKHDFTEILMKLAAGDKADFVMNVDTMVKIHMLPAYTNIFTKGGTLKGKIEIVKVYPNQEAAKADMDVAAKKEEEIRAVEMQKQMKEKSAKDKVLMESQTKELKAYAEKNKIKYVTSPLGVLVEVQNEGVGMKADSGKHAKLLYRGTLMNGKVFDANMGPDAKHKDPIDVAVGMHNTIPGFDDAMKYFGKGGKGRLLIPSPLAYGDRDMGDIPANSNMIFDIEVVDVVVEAPKPAAPEAHPSK